MFTIPDHRFAHPDHEDRLDDFFRDASIRVVPWASAPRTKNTPLLGAADASKLLAGSPAVADVDPRLLWATQTWVLRSHVAYYLTWEWHRTGTTSADRGKGYNRYPLVWIDRQGRHIPSAGITVRWLLSSQASRCERGSCGPLPTRQLQCYPDCSWARVQRLHT